MNDFIQTIMQVLAMEFSLGSLNFTLGQILIAGILLDQGRKFFERLSGGSVMDERARRHGFHDYSEYSAFEAYTNGGERHRDGRYY